jgi:hypothetical protein
MWQTGKSPRLLSRLDQIGQTVVKPTSHKARDFSVQDS